MGKVHYQKQVTAVSGQQTYTTVDDAVFGEEVIGIELALNAAAPYDWAPHRRWHANFTGTTPTYTLYFDQDTEPPNAYPMNIYYLAAHPEVKLDADLIHPDIHPERLKWEAAVNALRWRYTRTKQDDPSQIALLNESKERVAQLAQTEMAAAQAQLQAARMKYPILRKETPRLSKW